MKMPLVLVLISTGTAGGGLTSEYGGLYIYAGIEALKSSVLKIFNPIVVVHLKIKPVVI